MQNARANFRNSRLTKICIITVMLFLFVGEVQANLKGVCKITPTRGSSSTGLESRPYYGVINAQGLLRHCPQNKFDFNCVYRMIRPLREDMAQDFCSKFNRQKWEVLTDFKMTALDAENFKTHTLEQFRKETGNSQAVPVVHILNAETGEILRNAFHRLNDFPDAEIYEFTSIRCQDVKFDSRLHRSQK